VTFSPTTLPQDTINIAFGQAISVAGGTGNKTLSVTNVQGVIPGLHLPTGGTNTLTITGTPTATGTETFTVTAVDQIGGVSQQSFAITVNPAVTFTPSTLPIDPFGVPYLQTIRTLGGTGAVALTVDNIRNPIAGLTIPSAGTNTLTIGGTPTQGGTETFTITAVDSLGSKSQTDYSVTVNGPLQITTTALATYWTAGVSGYRQQIATSGGTGTITFALSAGRLPSGLSLTPADGTISGKPTTAGTFNFTVTASDGVGASTSQAYTVVILPPTFTLDGNSSTLSLRGDNLLFTQATTADAGGTHTTYSFTVDGAVSKLPDTAVAHVNVTSPSGNGVATFYTNDTYAGTDGQTHETQELLVFGNHSGQLWKVSAQGNSALFLQVSGFGTLVAYAGHADGGVISGTPNVPNSFASAGSYAYMNSGSAFYEILGAQYVYGYAANATDQAFHYDGSGPTAYVVSGTAYSFMIGTDNNQSFFNEAVGFTHNEGIARHGSQDTAYFYDSPLNDVFVGYRGYSYLYANNPDGTFAEYDVATGFGQVFAYSFVSAPGTDVAYVYDPVVNTVVGYQRIV
jgi:large repetitive protein